MAKRKRPSARSVQPAAIVASAAPQTTIAPHHDAAGTGRRLAFWRPAASGPNRANSGAATLRNRARDVARNDWAGRAISTRWSANLVGTGIIARPKTKDRALKSRLTELWDNWLEVCDADGVLDGYGQQSLVARNWIESGEVFIRLRPRRLSDGLPVPLQLQVLEADLVPHYDGVAPNGNRIVQGIELDSLGRRAAYWMYRNHPGEGMGDTGQLVRVEAQFVLHVYEPHRPGQLRGVSEFAPILAKLRSIGNFDDAVLHRQEIANLFAGFVEKAPSTTDPALDPLTGHPVQYGSDGAPLAALEPGIMQELLPGESVKFSDPPDAGANYAEFSRAQFQGVAAGVGLPYELLTGDVRDVSDRTLRVAIQEFRRHCQQRQWHILIPQFCRRVRHAWADAALLAGVLSEPEAREARAVTWVPQGWAYIHPTQDLQAQKIALESGLTSRSRIITERGDDPEEIDQERQEDDAREDDLGLSEAVGEDDPVRQAEIARAEAEAQRASQQARLIAAQVDREIAEARASAERLQAEAQQARALAQLAAAQARESEANAQLVAARAELEQAQAAESRALQAAADARAANENAVRIASLEAEAAQAKAESAARLAAMAEAEAHAREQRALVLEAERARAETAALELQAARLGLDELSAG